MQADGRVQAELSGSGALPGKRLAIASAAHGGAFLGIEARCVHTKPVMSAFEAWRRAKDLCLPFQRGEACGDGACQCMVVSLACLASGTAVML